MIPSCDLVYAMCTFMPCPWLICNLAVACLFVALKLPSWYNCQPVDRMFHFVIIIVINLCILWTFANGVIWRLPCLLYAHVNFINNKIDMLAVMCLPSQHHNVVDSMPSFLLVHDCILPWWLPWIYCSYDYAHVVCFHLHVVYFHDVPFVAMLLHYSIFVSCLQHAIILTLLMYMPSFSQSPNL